MRYENLLCVLILMVTCQAMAQENPTATESDKKSEKIEQKKVAVPTDQEKRFADFANLLKRSALVGTFTIDGDQQFKPRPERYEISKVVKQAQGDYWSFFARIKYAQHDVTVPVPVEVKWAGSTPVITVDNVTILGLGTFDARVLISDNKYAGTWRHGEVGGLMFGRIEKQKEKEDLEEAAEQPADAN